MAEKDPTSKPKIGARGGKSSRPAAPRAAPALSPPPAIPYTAKAVAEIFRRLAVQRPEPTSELEHDSAFTLLVAVVLSAQMTDVGVNQATRRLFALARTPEAMAALGEDPILAQIGNVTFARTKSRNLARLAQLLLDRHAGAVPQDREALEALPGVGPKTARVVLNTAFGADLLGVDTHIFRIGNRLKIAPGRTPDAVERAFLAIIPPEHLRHAHHRLLLHGRYVCKARKPLCPACVIADLCRADEKTTAVPAPLAPLPVRPPGFQARPPGAAPE